jgi:hypothetical protein
MDMSPMNQVEAAVRKNYNLAVRSCFSRNRPEFGESLKLAGHKPMGNMRD